MIRTNTLTNGYGLRDRTPAPPAANRGPSPAAVERVRAIAFASGWTTMTGHFTGGRPGESWQMRAAYKEMLRDEQVKACLLQKVRAVKSLDLQTEPDDPDDPQSVEFADFCRWAVERSEGRTSGVIFALLYHGLIEGHVLAQPVLRPHVQDRGKYRGKRGLWKVKAKAPDTYDLVLDEHMNVTGVRDRHAATAPPLDPRLFLIWSHLPWYEHPAGRSDLEAAYRHYLAKDAMLKLRVVYGQRLTGPFAKATNANPDDRADLELQLQAAAACGYVILPPGSTVDFVSLAAGADDVFKSAIRDCNEAIAIGLIGSYLTVMEGQNQGARGDTKEHRGTAELTQWDLSDCVAAVLENQLFPLLGDENYAAVAIPRATLSAPDPAATVADLKVGRELRESGVPTSKRAWYSKAPGWQPKDDGEDVLPGAGAAPPGGPVPGGGPGFGDDADVAGWVLEAVGEKGGNG